MFSNNSGCTNDPLPVVIHCLYYDSGSIVFEIGTRSGFYMYKYNPSEPMVHVWN